MSLQLITPPALEPVTLGEAKAHLKLDTDADDALVTRLIAAARTRVEWSTGRALVTQGWALTLDRLPESGVVEIPLPPLQAVTEIGVYKPDDSETVLDASAWQADVSSAPGRVLFREQSSLPGLRALAAIRIAFTAGFGGAADNVPALLREAILEIVAEMHANRGDTGADLPPAAQALLAPWRAINF